MTIVTTSAGNYAISSLEKKESQSFSQATFGYVTSWKGMLDTLDWVAKEGCFYAQAARLLAWQKTAESIQGVAKGVRFFWVHLSLFRTREAVGEGAFAVHALLVERSVWERLEEVVERGLNGLSGTLQSIMTVGKMTGTLDLEAISLLKTIADASAAARRVVLGYGQLEESLDLLFVYKALPPQGELAKQVASTCKLRMLEAAKNILGLSVFLFRAYGAASGVALISEIILLNLSATGAFLGCASTVYKAMQDHKPVSISQ